jgi:hypothetical protein
VGSDDAGDHQVTVLDESDGIALTMGGPAVNGGQNAASMTPMCTTMALEDRQLVTEPHEVRRDHAVACRGPTI